MTEGGAFRGCGFGLLLGGLLWGALIALARSLWP